MLSVTCFPAFTIGYTFPRIAIGYLFSRARYRLLVFPRLPSVTCLPAHAISYMFCPFTRSLGFKVFWPISCVGLDWMSYLLILFHCYFKQRKIFTDLMNCCGARKHCSCNIHSVYFCSFGQIKISIVVKVIQIKFLSEKINEISTCGYTCSINS